MFSARGVALNVTTASVQLRMLRESVYFPRGQSYEQLTVHGKSVPDHQSQFPSQNIQQYKAHAVEIYLNIFFH
jgi:hypothetical protein